MTSTLILALVLAWIGLVIVICQWLGECAHHDSLKDRDVTISAADLYRASHRRTP